MKLETLIACARPYATSSKPGPKGGTLAIAKFHIDELETAFVVIGQCQLEDITAEGNVPTHRRGKIAGVFVHLFDGVEVVDGVAKGTVEINLRRVTPSWRDGEVQYFLSVNVKPTYSTPGCRVEFGLTTSAWRIYGPDTNGGVVTVTTL